MSRLAKKPIVFDSSVTLTVSGDMLTFKGPFGSNSLTLPRGVFVEASDGCVYVRSDTSKERQGLCWSLMKSMANGVLKGYEKELEINGVGYKVDLKGDELVFSLGFSHLVKYTLPKGVKVVIDKQTKIKIQGVDKQLVGQVSADIKHLKYVEPYKGKGIRDVSEVVRRKVGKSAGSGGKGK